MAAVVAASRSLAKCWLRPAARAVSDVLTLPGSSESDLPSPSSLFPQAARLSGKPLASGLAWISPRVGAGHCRHGALRVLPEQRARSRPAACGAFPVSRPYGDLGEGTGPGARDEAESQGRSPAAGSSRAMDSVCSSLFWSEALGARGLLGAAPLLLLAGSLWARLRLKGVLRRSVPCSELADLSAFCPGLWVETVLHTAMRSSWKAGQRPCYWSLAV